MSNSLCRSSVRRVRQLLLICALSLSSAGLSYGQDLETPPAPAGSPKPSPYLKPGTVDYRTFLGSPPVVGSLRDKTDVAIDQQFEHDADSDRWQVANQDADYVFDRFADAFGKPVRRDALPWTIHLLHRAIRDVANPTFEAKKAFHRPRPFQRYQVSRICGEDKPPAPEVNPTTGSSYPSGHSAYGWMTALVLAEVAPDRTDELFQRADDYGQSRLVCAVHFPSDVEAGRVIATAVFVRLQRVPAFRHDLKCARLEYAGKRACKRPH